MNDPTSRPDVPARGVHVIPGRVPEGVVPPSASLTPPTEPLRLPGQAMPIARTIAVPGPTGDWTITVTVPADLPAEMCYDLADAVGDAVRAWEPDVVVADQPATSRPDVPGDASPAASAALARAIDAGYAEVYMSGGGKIEFTDAGFLAWYLAEVAEIERRAVEAERAAIVRNIRHYFAVSDAEGPDGLWEDVQVLCGWIERGEYGARNEGRDA